MSANSDNGFISLRVVLEHGTNDGKRLGQAVLALYDAVGARPNRLVTSRWKKSRAFKRPVLEEAVTDPLTRHFLLRNIKDDDAESFIYVRDDPSVEEFTDRATAVVVRGPSNLAAVLAFVRSLGELCGVVGGGITGHATRLYAAKECKQNGVDGQWDAATVERIEWDAWKWRKTRTKLTRLNPITIIGPSIWAQLPPMPAFDPAPVVEDLGAVKLLRAWPTLVPPRDPAFLHGTRALREWLWPYTIQNPADGLDRDPDASVSG